MAGDKKRKGTSRSKKALIYKNSNRLGTNRNERAKVQKRKFIKEMRGIGVDVTLDTFTKCGVCMDKLDRVLTNTVAPLLHETVEAHGRKEMVLYGGHCVRCGKAFAQELKEARKALKALKEVK